MSDPTPAAARWTVAYLCAAWCRTCDDVRPQFEARALAHPQVAHVWIDVEDEADDLGDLDIVTFPTLLVVRDGVPLYFGPVRPRAEAVEALLAALARDPQPRTGVSIDLGPLLARLQHARPG